MSDTLSKESGPYPIKITIQSVREQTRSAGKNAGVIDLVGRATFNRRNGAFRSVAFIVHNSQRPRLPQIKAGDQIKVFAALRTFPKDGGVGTLMRVIGPAFPNVKKAA